MNHGAVPHWATATLSEIISGERRVQAIRHPLGFRCLPVERSGDDGTCLHLWSDDPAGIAPTTSEIHCHSWDLESHVLCGRIRNELLPVTDARIAPTHRVFEVVSRDGVDEILPTPQTVRYGPPLASEHAPGDVYRMPAGVFHRSWVAPDRPTLTAVFGSGVPGSRDLSLGRLNAAPHQMTRLRCSPGETMRLARLAADLLTEARPRLR